MTTATLHLELETLEEAVGRKRVELERRVAELANQVEASRSECDELRFDIDDACRSIGWLRSERRALTAAPAPRPGRWLTCLVAVCIAVALWMIS